MKLIQSSVLVLLTSDKTVNESISSFLNQRGYSVYVATNQEDAIREIRTKAVDVLICDTSILKSDDEILGFYLNQSNDLGLPLVLISADLSDEQENWFKRLSGVKTMLPNPIDLNQVSRLIAANLPQGHSAMSFADSDLDKPLVDPTDLESIKIDTRVRRLGDGTPQAGVVGNLIEYSEKAVLLEVSTSAFEENQTLHVSISLKGIHDLSFIELDGKILSVEELDSGCFLLTVDFESFSSDFLKKMMSQIVERQAQILDFLRRAQG